MPTTPREFDFSIGADPEFTLTMQGRKVDAKQTMELMLKGKDGLRKVDGGYAVEDKGNIGWDGASSTAEIRPSPSTSPQKVVDNLAAILKKFTEHVKICDMSTISEFSSIGGHIHLEIPKGESWTSEKKILVHRRLASFYLPILLSENKTNLNLRLRQGYGSLKDQRVEQKFTYPDGMPGYTFEFRCPSAEWLTTPKVAKATLAYIATVYHEIIKHPKSFTKFNDIIYKSDKQGDALQTLAIMEYDLLTRGILNRARKYIRTFEMYPAFKDEIEFIFTPKLVIKDKQSSNFNIAQGWKLLPAASEPKKSEIMASKKRIQNIAEQTDFDILKRVMNIHYNNDTNVAMFAETLKDRVAAFNWKLKNNYFIFGMRKGLPEIIAKNIKGEFIAGQEVLKTRMDADAMNRLFSKMTDKFMNEQAGALQNTTIDFITGKPKDLRESIIIIGLPYDMRVKENLKPFLSFIWELERNDSAIKPKRITENLIDDTAKLDSERGDIFKILNKITETHQPVMDSGSRSLSSNQNVLREMACESSG